MQTYPPRSPTASSSRSPQSRENYISSRSPQSRQNYNHNQRNHYQNNQTYIHENHQLAPQNDSIASTIGSACRNLEDSCISFLVPILQQAQEARVRRAAQQRARENQNENNADEQIGVPRYNPFVYGNNQSDEQQFSRRECSSPGQSPRLLDGSKVSSPRLSPNQDSGDTSPAKSVKSVKIFTPQEEEKYNLNAWKTLNSFDIIETDKNLKGNLNKESLWTMPVGFDYTTQNENDEEDLISKITTLFENVPTHFQFFLKEFLENTVGDNGKIFDFNGLNAVDVGLLLNLKNLIDIDESLLNGDRLIRGSNSQILKRSPTVPIEMKHNRTGSTASAPSTASALYDDRGPNRLPELDLSPLSIDSKQYSKELENVLQKILKKDDSMSFEEDTPEGSGEVNFMMNTNENIILLDVSQKLELFFQSKFDSLSNIVSFTYTIPKIVNNIRINDHLTFRFLSKYFLKAFCDSDNEDCLVYSSDVTWALHCHDRASLFTIIVENSPGGLQWDVIRRSGVMFWLRLSECGMKRFSKISNFQQPFSKPLKHVKNNQPLGPHARH